MADTAGPKAAKTFKRKNFKGLALPPKKEDTTPSAGDAQAPGGHANDIYRDQENLGGQLATLEIGVEFKLDIRSADLDFIQDLGAGNSGQVSKVIHQATRTVMAKKVVHIDAKPAVRKQILRELTIMHECHSPYIVSFYGAFLNEGDVVMCMEYMDCGSLDNIAKKVGPIRIDVLGKIAEAVVEGLHYLYNEHKILHRDIKPSNILVNSRGSIKLCDFGVSGELINSIAQTFVGTSTYMAPERIQGAQYSVKSDVWSLGLSLLELAIGRFPFDADCASAGTRASAGTYGILDLLQRIVHEPAPRLPKNPAFPVSLEKMIEQCLIKDPDKRPSPEDLLSVSFMRSAKATKVDLEGWARELVGKSGRSSHQYRSSVSIKAALHQREAPAPLQQAPPRPTSTQRPPPPRRPSASVESTGTPTDRRPSQVSASHPARTSSHSQQPSRSSRMTSTDLGNMASPQIMQSPPPPPPQSHQSRPSIHKAYTESTATSISGESNRHDSWPKERSYSSGGNEETIGIGLEDAFSNMSTGENHRSPPGNRNDGGPEMREKKRMPPTATMTTSSGGAMGVTNGWDRNQR